MGRAQHYKPSNSPANPDGRAASLRDHYAVQEMSATWIQGLHCRWKRQADVKVTRAKSTGLVADVDVRGESERKARGYSQISGPAGGTDGEAVDLGQSIQEEKQEVIRCFLSLFCLKHPWNTQREVSSSVCIWSCRRLPGWQTHRGVTGSENSSRVSGHKGKNTQ